MTNNDIRNFEFKMGKGQVFVNNNGEVEYAGDRKSKKQLKQLKPLFDAILKADSAYTCNKKNLDSESEKALMTKLHNFLMADGVIDENELKLGDEFKRSGKSITEFLSEKLGTPTATDEENSSVVRQPETNPSQDVNPELPVQPEVQVEENVPQEKAPVEMPETPKQRDSRVSNNAFNQSIQVAKQRIQDQKDTLTSQFTATVKVVNGKYLYNIAVEALKAEGVASPTPKQINDRIAEIALVNGINNINRIPTGTVLKVGTANIAGETDSTSESAAGNEQEVAEGSVTDKPAKADGHTTPKVGPSSIKIPERIDFEKSEVDGYKYSEKKDGDFNYREYTKEGSPTVYATQGYGVQFKADSLEALKAKYEKFKQLMADNSIKKPVDNETEEAKAERQAANFETIKEIITTADNDVGAIVKAVSLMHGDGVLALESPEVQAFVQDLIKTKDVKVLKAILHPNLGKGVEPNSGNFKNTLLANDKTSAETLAALWTEIRAKENAGEKLEPKEVELKEFLKSEMLDNDLYKIEADENNGVYGKVLRVGKNSGELYYTASIDIDGKSYTFDAKDSATLDLLLKDVEDADTDEKKAAVFKKYMNSDDKLLKQTMAVMADCLKASKEDILTFVNNNDMYVLQSLNYQAGDADFKKALADRVTTLYQQGNGDPANMRYLDKALEYVEAACEKDEDKDAAKKAILETFFEVTETQGEDGTTTKSYTFKPSRRPTIEEMDVFLDQKKTNFMDSDMISAIKNSITVDEMGKGTWCEACEVFFDGLSSHYAELIADMDAEQVLDFIQNKMLENKGCNIPFDKIIEKFPELKNTPDLRNELLNNISEKSTIGEESGKKLLLSALNDKGELVLPDGCDIKIITEKLLPNDCSDGDAKKCFSAVLKKVGEDIGALVTLATRVTDNNSKDEIKKVVNGIVDKLNNEKIVALLQQDSLKSLVDKNKLVNIDFNKDSKWTLVQKQFVFEVIFDGALPSEEQAKFLKNAVANGLVEDLGNDFYQIKGGGYSFTTLPSDEQGKKESVIRKVNNTGVTAGQKIFDAINGVTLSNTDAINALGEIDENNAAEAIIAFRRSSNADGDNEGLMQFLGNEWQITTKYNDKGKDVANALLKQADAVNLASNSEYKEVESYLKDKASDILTKDFDDKLMSLAKKIIQTHKCNNL